MKKVAVKKPTRLEALSLSVAQNWAHANSATINSHRRVLQCEAEEADKSIVALTAAATNLRTRRQQIDAILAGLSTVMDKR